MTDLADIYPCPWRRHSWSGKFKSLDGTDTADFTAEDVDRVVAWYTAGDRWDGDTAGIVALVDGRIVSWEADYGPTGDGFCCDAYGGTADILFAATVEAALAGLSEKARDGLRGQAP